MVSSGDPEQTAPEPPRLLERSIALVRATCSCAVGRVFVARSCADCSEGLILGHCAASLRAVRHLSSIVCVAYAQTSRNV